MDPYSRPRWRLVLRTFVFGAIIALLSGLPAARVAADEIDLSYDIYSRDKQLMVWVDLSSLLDAPTVTRLEDGIDLLLECQASLGVPRRFFGDNLVTRKSDIWRLSYRSVTEEYIVARPLVSDSTVSRFASLATLFQHFRDSIEVSLVPLDSLEVQERFVLTLEVTTISMTGLNIAPKEESSGGGESPLRFLFRQFLNLTDYGRNEYKTKSRPFAIDEIEPEL